MYRDSRTADRQTKNDRLKNITTILTGLKTTFGLTHIHQQDLPLLAEGRVCLENHYLGEDIFALLVFHLYERIATFVITEFDYYIVARPPIEIIDQLCRHKNKVPFLPHLRNGIAMTLGKLNYVVPFACKEYSLMPLGRKEHSLEIWLNPAHIDDIVQINQQTYVVTSFGWSIPVPIKERSLKERMTRSFIVHGIYVKKALEFTGPLTGSLHYLLNIRSSAKILEVLAQLTIADVPYDYQEIHDNAMKSRDQQHDRRFGEDPLDHHSAS